MSGLAGFGVMLWAGIVISWWAYLLMKWAKEDFNATTAFIAVAFGVVVPPLAALAVAILGALCLTLTAPIIERVYPGYFSTLPFGVCEQYDGGTSASPRNAGEDGAVPSDVGSTRDESSSVRGRIQR